MNNAKVIEGLKPELFWKYLAEISNIPRGSGNEAGIRAFIQGVWKFCTKLCERFCFFDLPLHPSTQTPFCQYPYAFTDLLLQLCTG